jgi:hypothetical protein
VLAFSPSLADKVAATGKSIAKIAESLAKAIDDE